MRADWEIWDIARVQRVLLLRDISYGAISFHPRLPLLIAGQTSGRVAMWNVEKGVEGVRFPLARAPIFLRFAPDGQRFAALSALGDGFVLTVHDAATGAPVASHAFIHFVNEFAWHP